MPNLTPRRPITDPEALPHCLHPVLRRVYAARGVSGAAELDYAATQLCPPDGLVDLPLAATILASAVTEGRRVLIVGDFDADGATSAAVAIRALSSFGAPHVDYLIPSRFKHGYGLTPPIAEMAAERGAEILVTVDNGIASHAGVTAARAQGLAVVVTDHHLPTGELPAADAVVDPNRADDRFPSKALAGVGVVFYLMTAIRGELRRQGWFGGAGPASAPSLATLLDLVALGTVADLAPLDHNNRVLVEQGLRRLRAGQGCWGVHALIEAAGRQSARLTASDLGFAVAPRLNAAGRLDDMSVGVACLLSQSRSGAAELAGELDRLNKERRAVESRMHEEAEALVAEMPPQLAQTGESRALCLFDDGWHEGVIGLLASRLRQRYERPVIALAPSSGTLLKGSARSVPGLPMQEVLTRIAARHSELLVSYGGHAMAAGLSLRVADLPQFRAALHQEVAAMGFTTERASLLQTDGELAAAELGVELAAALRDAGPWGQGFPEPVFQGRFEILNRRIVGQHHVKLSLRGADSEAGTPLDAIAFYAVAHGWAAATGTIVAAYRLNVDQFRDRQRLQLIIEHLEPAGDAGVTSLSEEA